MIHNLMSDPHVRKVGILRVFGNNIDSVSTVQPGILRSSLAEESGMTKQHSFTGNLFI